MGYSSKLMDMFSAMREALGPSHWWPGDTPLEIAVGAILTQNTNWQNVEKAIGNLKAVNALTPEDLLELPLKSLADLIRPAGYYNIKAKRLGNFLRFLHDEAGLEMEQLKGWELYDIRSKLLSVNGIGPETCDAILLYALDYPVFVVDAYTARMMSRHGFCPEEVDYHELQALFMDALPEDVALFNEYHALIVRIGKDWCKKKAGLCDSCPLQDFL